MATNFLSAPLRLFLFLSLFTISFMDAQIGIGTTSPHPSSILDIESSSQGMLAPRLTTIQRGAIASPADGLLVYDTDLKIFLYFSSASATWIPFGGSLPRLNFKRIRSTDNLATVLAQELTAGGGSKYQLTSNTLYEINGQVVFNLPIDLNNAYLNGLDANEDIVMRTSGNLFEGTTGGSIRNLTVSTPGATVFSLNAASSASTFLMRDCIVANSNNIGTISGFGLVFMSIVNFSGNANGITYNNIGQLLLSNQAWFSNNVGTYEKFTGSFNLIAKQGGFSNVNAAGVGMDVSTGLSIAGAAVLESVVFTGPVAGNYVMPYVTGTYPGYNFNNSWSVRAAGLPAETDGNAAGGFAMDYAVGSGLSVSLNNNNPSNIVKVGSGAPPTLYSNLFRFLSDAPNSLKYQGKNRRIFQISGSISFQVPGAGTYIVYIAKNGTVLSQYKVYGRGAAASDIVVLPLNASAELANNDVVEVYVQRYSGTTGTIIVPNLTITVQ